MLSDENKGTGLNEARLTRTDLTSIIRGDVRYSRSTMTRIARHLLRSIEEKDSAVALINKLNTQIWRDKLYMLDEVFVPQDFGFKQHIESDEDGSQHLLYVSHNKEYAIRRAQQTNNEWIIHTPGGHISITINNAYEAYVTLGSLGVSFKLIEY